MHLPSTLLKLSLVALAVLGASNAQDDGPGFVTKCVNPGEVALTFDDGPSPFTTKLLGYLAQEQVYATFFVLGVSINGGYADALKAAFKAGHQIALHSNTHADMNTLTPAKIKEEYEINLKAVQDNIGVSPIMARPPFGNCNAACAKVLQGEMGLTVIQWNCDSNDWMYEANAADQPKLFTNIANIINPSNPKTDSFITLQHDIKGYSVEYVPRIIQLIKSKGYKFVTVEQCLGGKIPAYKGGNAAPAAGGAAPAPAAAPAGAPAPAPAAAPAAANSKATPPKYLDGAKAPANTTMPAPAGSSMPAANAAGKLSSAFSMTLLCLALGLLY